MNRHTETASPNNCNHCGKIYCHESQLRQHLATNHLGGGVPARPANLDEPIIGQTPYQELAEYQGILNEHRDTIGRYQTNRPLWKKINAETNPGFTYTDLKTLLDEIMSSECI